MEVPVATSTFEVEQVIRNTSLRLDDLLGQAADTVEKMESLGWRPKRNNYNTDCPVKIRVTPHLAYEISIRFVRSVDVGVVADRKAVDNEAAG